MQTLQFYFSGGTALHDMPVNQLQGYEITGHCMGKPILRKSEHDALQDKVSRRNMQIKDLKTDRNALDNYCSQYWQKLLDIKMVLNIAWDKEPETLEELGLNKIFDICESDIKYVK